MHFIVTLVERDYLYGACALFNSLLVNGYDGTFVIGYRNKNLMPHLALKALEDRCSNVMLVELDTKTHFTNYKPTFLRQILSENPVCSTITYIDPDIVINSSADWILSWSSGGPAVCADTNYFMPSNHPTRHQWVETTGIKVIHNLDLYFNGGFLGLSRVHSSFLDLWHDLIQHANCETPLDAQGEIHHWRREGRAYPFMALDQDALNIALMAWDGPITTLGPDVMGFAGSALMPHALGMFKPWQRNYISHALQGKPPREVDKLYWSYANSVMQIHRPSLILIKKLSIKFASLIGRFYRKF